MCLAFFSIFHLAQAQGEVPSTVTSVVLATSSGSGGGSLNGPIRSSAVSSGATSATATTTFATVPTAVPSLTFSDAQVPYLLQSPAAAHRKHNSKPRVKSQFSGCADTGLDQADPALRVNVSAVYTQLDRHPLGDEGGPGGLLRITGVGAISETAFGAANETFAAIQVSSRFLTFDIFSNLTFLCDSVVPTGDDANTQLTAHASCTYGPGTVAFGVDVPVNATYELGTIETRVLLIDTSHPPLSIACVDVPFSPYDEDAWYWDLMFWLPVALFIAYFTTVSLARAITAATTRSRAFRNRAREGRAPSFLRDHLNPIIISAISGQGMVLSPALLRFATPGCWDILFQLQFVAILAMCAVNWPDFAYPFFKQAAWASLVGNVTVVGTTPLSSLARLPSGVVGDQMGNTTSPIYLNSSAPVNFIDMHDVYTGIPAFAEIIGLERSKLFATCMVLWLLIVAVFVAVAVAGWVIDTIALTSSKIKQRREDDQYEPPSAEPKGATLGAAVVGQSGETPTYVADGQGNIRDTRHNHYGFLGSFPRGFNPNPHFHMAALHGNVVRALAMFHLPITVFTVYHMTHADEFSTKSVALAALSFAIVALLLPAYLIWRIARAPARKLYDNIETLLALGPVYNTFSPGSQLFYCVTFAHSLIVGVVIGAAQNSGSAQAIILLVLEILLALASSLWLPWGEGAMMGPVSFMTSVLRVISAVLVVLLSAVVDLSAQATQWITYVVLLLQGIFFAGAALILVFKLVESFIRLAFGVPYDERVNARSGGIGGAIRRIRRRRDKILQLSKPRKQRRRHRHGGSSGSQSLMLSDAMPARPTSFASMSGIPLKANPNSPSSPSIPLSRSRQASFASYLDYPTRAADGTPAVTPGHDKRRSSSSALDLLNGPYAAYFQHEGDEEDANIMAALPPTSPGPWGASGPQGNEAVTQSTAPKPPTVGFERVRGGRATDADPYTSTGAARARDGFGRHTAAELSSTASAAQFARAHSRRDTPGPHRATRIFRGFSRRSPRDHAQSEEDYITSEDEDDPWAGTWGTSTLSTQHGPWNGLAKMQAALSGFKGRLTGRPAPSSSGEGTLGGISEEGGSLPPPSSGFQVIRQPRRAAPESSDMMDSTAIAMHHAASTPGAEKMDSVSAAPPRPTSRGSSAYFTPPPSRPLSSGPNASRARASPPPLLQLRHLDTENGAPDADNSNPRALGIMEADLRRAASDARVDAQEEEERAAQSNREDRFWRSSRPLSAGDQSPDAPKGL